MMSISEIIKAMCSDDNHQAWQAAWEIVRTPQSVVQEEYVPHLPKIKRATLKLPEPQPPYLRDSRDIVKLAVLLLENVAKGKCHCSVYPTTDQVLAKSQKKHKLVTIVEEHDMPWEPEFICKCRDCGQLFKVKENHAYHYPCAQWTKIVA